jgi:hypothetical protein
MRFEREPPRSIDAFSLQGGPLYRLGVRLGLVRSPRNTVRLGLAIAAVLWIVPALLALANGEPLFNFASNKQKSVYYGADGTLQKVEIASSPAPRQKPGLRGAVAAAKKEELTDYMQAAVALVKTYLPLDPNAIQAAMASGRVSVDVLDPGRRVRVNIRNYKMQGDTVAVEFDIAANRPLGIKISTYLQDPGQVVLLSAGMGQLADGTTYAANITLDAAAKNLRVNVQNSGHRKLP